MIPTEMTNSFVTIEDTKIHYVSAGKGEAILLIHGWPTSAYLWRNIIPELSKNNLVIAVDLPGFGASDKHIDASFSFRYYERILNGLLNHLSIEKLTLGVHDLGGPVGLFWMVNNMHKVDRLILFNTLVYPEFSWGVKLFMMATMFPGLRNWITSQSGIERAIKFGVYQKEKLSDEIIQNYQDPFKDVNSRKVLLKSVQRLSPKGFHKIAKELSNYKGPVQIIYGENDKILPKVGDTMKRIQQDLPQAKLTALPECGHFLQEDKPDEIAKLVSNFIQETS